MDIRENNNFDFIRFCAASLVLLSHSFPLVEGNNNSEPLSFLTHGGLSIGTASVIIFFVISGFLISGSWDNRKHFPGFMAARVLRIFPGLAVMLFATILMGAFITSGELKDYLVSSWSYTLRNFFLYSAQPDLPGVFAANPFGPVVNGSLWTLRLEFTCYLMIGLLGVAGMFRRSIVWVVWLGGLVLSQVHALPTTFLKTLFPLLAWFASGMLVYFYRDQHVTRLHIWIFFGVIAVFAGFGINLIFLSPLIAYLLIKAAYLKSPLSNFGRYGDFSYGMYIYAFPIQQLVVSIMLKHYSSHLQWWSCFVVSLPITFCCAVMSWNLVEKRFLKLKA